MKRAVLILAVLYLFLLIAVSVVMHSRLNDHWSLTLFLLAPRWAVALPLILTVPLTLGIRPRLSWIYAVHMVVILFGIMGYTLGTNNNHPPQMNPILRILSCNTGGGTLDQGELISLIRKHQIDVVMLQECSTSISAPLFRELGWQHRQAYNIAIGSPFPLEDPERLAHHPGRYNAIAAMSCTVHWAHGDAFQVVSVHLPTFRPALEELRHFNIEQGSEKFDEVSKGYQTVAEQVQEAVKEILLPKIVAGDFNIPVESQYYKDYWGDFQNAYSVAGSGFGYTKFTRFHGVRIDHLLADEHWKVLKTWVGPSLGGDHRPVIVELIRH